MIPQEIFQKVKKIEIITRKLVRDLFAGEYHSIFKGRGMEFSEVREYSIGDDIRMIDWNVTARMGSPYIKKFSEERELTVMLLIDMSASSRFGTRNQLKSEITAEISALLAFSAIKNNDKVGMIIFTDQIEKYIPPKKGRSHILRLIREILYFKPCHTKTDINVTLEYLNRVTKRKSIVFLISDLHSPDFTRSISITNKKHDLIVITLVDPREKILPSCGFVVLEDSETGEDLYIDSSHPLLQNTFQGMNENYSNQRSKFFQSIRCDEVIITTEQSYVNPLISFFRMREKRYR
ncbi:MAG: DUF58 domain-containing protein [Spirochaetes bacterium]|nr:DUF58 domain-containing protein [Spirochaetota bacterium]